MQIGIGNQKLGIGNRIFSKIPESNFPISNSQFLLPKTYFIHNNPTTAIRLQSIFLCISSRSPRSRAAAIKTITILNVVIDETILKFPTTKINTTHDKDWKNLSTPVIAISLEV